MKSTILFHLLMLLGSLLCGPTMAQEQNAALPDSTLIIQTTLLDSLPLITMKVEPVVVVLSLVTGTFLFVGGRSYEIEGKKHFFPSIVKPYFLAAKDSTLLMQWYRRSTWGRVIWYSTATVGTGFTMVGFVYALVSFFDPSYAQAASDNFLVGGGLGVLALVARIISFKTLEKAVKLYNFRRVGSNPVVSLRLGGWSQTPAGMALRLTF